MKKPTSADLKKLAAKLIETESNVFRVAEGMGLKFTEEDWEKMESQENIFKCEECNRWLPESENEGDDLCASCQDERSADDLEDEDDD